MSLIKRMPKSVSILGIPFTIDYTAEFKSDDGDQPMGEMIASQRVIKVCSGKNSTKELIESTLFHEIIHAALYLSGHSESLKAKKEEAIVLALENALAPLFKRNF